jgi:hypothetical protein
MIKFSKGAVKVLVAFAPKGEDTAEKAYSNAPIMILQVLW